MKPYKNLSSKHLALLLMITRVTTVVSLLAVVLSLIGLASQFWMTRGFSLNFWSTVGIATLIPSLQVLLGSGIIAAIIAFEESYRQKSEAFIASLK
ncbi:MULTISPECIES: hypothetical protein [unclassified Shewanella]|uniref:hypothetical protein n=1 Tax=unclassified Shewanella TaxID=196818 RepID=UPI001B47F145|nr:MULTISPECIES: hypothetical protein [unclassified Shewanella]MBP6519990.1 hypothetical protein [Shewanella sp.]MCU8085605.1 hypothetical protein [Shewanella sp. SM23]